ncbi:MAG: hypothetical protein ACRD36_13660, partial [Candidatus Acidiferrum sp.]
GMPEPYLRIIRAIAGRSRTRGGVPDLVQFLKEESRPSELRCWHTALTKDLDLEIGVRTAAPRRSALAQSA